MNLLKILSVVLPGAVLGTFLFYDLLNCIDIFIPYSRERRGLKEFTNKNTRNTKYTSENKTEDSLKYSDACKIQRQDSSNEEYDTGGYTEYYISGFPIIAQPFTTLLIFLSRHTGIIKLPSTKSKQNLYK